MIFKRKVVIVPQPKLSSDEMAQAMAAYVDKVPFFDAFMQLLDEHERECINNAVGMVGNHGAVASEVGGMQVLGELRQKLIMLRDEGRKEA